MADLEPSSRNPLPWRKELLEMEETPGRRTIKRFAIKDADGGTVMEQLMILERSEDTIDFALEQKGAPAPEHPLPWRKRLLQMRRGKSGAKLERFAIVDPYGVTVLFQPVATFDAERTVDYILARVNAVVVREVEVVSGS